MCADALNPGFPVSRQLVPDIPLVVNTFPSLAFHVHEKTVTLRRNFIAAAITAATLTMSIQVSAQTELKAADVHPPGYPTVAATENMGKKFEAATNGKHKMQMYPSSVLGDEKIMIEQTQILRTSLGPLGSVLPTVNVFNMPFVFRNEAHMRAFIGGPIGQEILDKISASPARRVALTWHD